MRDLIERKKAIDIVNAYKRQIDPYPRVVESLEKLPSAQPEIVRCKDCTHHWTHRCMDSIPTEICELGQTFYDANVDFCSLAERRTDGV